MRKQLSAKDKAFEKEKAEFRKTIIELTRELNPVKFVLYDKLHSMQKELDSKNKEIENQQKIIDELKRCAKLSDDQLKTLLKVKEFESKVNGLFNLSEYLRYH